VVACLDTSFDNKYIDNKIYEGFLSDSEDLANQPTAFRKSLLSNPKK